MDEEERRVTGRSAWAKPGDLPQMDENFTMQYRHHMSDWCVLRGLLNQYAERLRDNVKGAHIEVMLNCRPHWHGKAKFMEVYCAW